MSPFIQAFYYSMTDWSGFTPVMNFIGIDNYVRLFQDDTFVKSLGNNVVLVIVLPIVTIILSLILATLVTVGGRSKGQISGLKHAGFYRVVSFFPYVIPAIAIGLMWRQVFAPNGLVNGALTGLGLDQFINYAWLGEVATAMPVSMFVIIWGFVGFYMVLFVAAIKGIPAEIYEAARLDGAGRFRTAVSVTIPMIRDNVQTAYIYMGILALDAFVYMEAMNPGGGPAFSTIVMPQVLLDTAFSQGQFGRASAMGVILALVTLTFAGLVFLINSLTGGTKKDVRL
ncbi:N-acetylglucosamine transport system permease protein [Arthrobacter pigmenti]|uniref:N-acetylglucosamine transport system permease protein n=1 Tax=Arthrobacter pigmenti TaxID=271432 RepID=A0A846RJL8_9MICC|nr:N-acetylglucosamine transport system permease protein [Arthrobacter pigmenti]